MKYLILLLILLSTNALAESSEFPLDVLVNGKNYEVTALIDFDNEQYWAINKKELLLELSAFLTDNKVRELESANPQEFWEQSVFDQLEWSASYRPDELTLYIAIPTKQQKQIDIQFSSYNTSSDGDSLYSIVKPEAFSGMLNTTLTHTKNLTGSKAAASSISIRTAMNWRGITLEDGHTYTVNHENNTDNILRDHTRLMFDLANDKGFVQFGDYQVETDVSNLPSGELFGLSYSYQPDYLGNYFTPNAIPIVLESTSLIQIKINGEDFRSIRLNSGQYNLRDLPLDDGVNEVEVSYVDQSGIEKKEFYNIINHPQLLLQGDVETQSIVGVYQEYSDLGEKKLDKEKPGVQSVVSYGITPWWTISPKAEYREDYARYAVKQTFAVSDYIVSLDVNRYDTSTGDSFGGSGSIYSSDLLYNLLSSSNLSYKYQEDSSSGEGTHSLDFTSSLTPFQEWGFMGFSLGGATTEDEVTRRYASINTNLNWFSSMYMNVNLRWEDYNEKIDRTVYVSFSIPLDWNNITLNATSSYDSSKDRQSHRVSASKYEQDYNWRVTSNFSDQELDGIDSAYTYYGEKTNVRARYSSRSEYTDDKTRYVSLSAESGIAWAGTNVKWTSPIQSSFVMVALPEDLEGYKFEQSKFGSLDIVESADESDTNSLAIIEVGDRASRKINVTGKELEFSEELENNTFLVKSELRSGSLISLKITKGYYVIGQFIGKDNSPIEDLVGAYIDTNTGKKYDFFTDESGYYEAGLMPVSQYDIEFYNRNIGSIASDLSQFPITEDTFIEIGDTTLNTN